MDWQIGKPLHQELARQRNDLRCRVLYTSTELDVERNGDLKEHVFHNIFSIKQLEKIALGRQFGRREKKRAENPQSDILQ